MSPAGPVKQQQQQSTQPCMSPNPSTPACTPEPHHLPAHPLCHLPAWPYSQLSRCQPGPIASAETPSPLHPSLACPACLAGLGQEQHPHQCHGTLSSLPPAGPSCRQQQPQPRQQTYCRCCCWAAAGARVRVCYLTHCCCCCCCWAAGVVVARVAAGAGPRAAAPLAGLRGLSPPAAATAPTGTAARRPPAALCAAPAPHLPSAGQGTGQGTGPAAVAGSAWGARGQGRGRGLQQWQAVRGGPAGDGACSSGRECVGGRGGRGLQQWQGVRGGPGDWAGDGTCSSGMWCMGGQAPHTWFSS